VLHQVIVVRHPCPCSPPCPCTLLLLWSGGVIGGGWAAAELSGRRACKVQVLRTKEKEVGCCCNYKLPTKLIHVY
jgi:hypothetical protein